VILIITMVLPLALTAPTAQQPLSVCVLPALYHSLSIHLLEREAAGHERMSALAALFVEGLQLSFHSLWTGEEEEGEGVRGSRRYLVMVIRIEGEAHRREREMGKVR
jgi:hypothetical protein